ncbi:aminotransferase class IV [Cesiribacter sp. SM1]|uniref:aminotransferase class IV n=1 Tax=Cesiribacter sp. SM1 TaxID=2861196 RepID=UPI001CD7FAF3|nr:aminotransferase class IV [Cesiribacter sp. SM1]
MNALLNGTSISAELAAALQNRGFRFGDGCFETMLVYNGECPLLSQHHARIRRSLSILDIHWPESTDLEAQIRQLCPGNTGWQRLRLWIWRSGEGLYTPESNEAQSLLAASPATAPRLQQKQQIMFSEEVTLLPSRWSFIKTISALPYVMATQEKKKKKAEELILLNHRGEIAEATVANLFWKKRKRWYTPALDSGCVAGVMRAWLMRKMIEKGEPVFEVLAQPDELLKVDRLVCTNVTGLQPVLQLGDKQYDADVEELWSLLPDEYRNNPE